MQFGKIAWRTTVAAFGMFALLAGPQSVSGHPVPPTPIPADRLLGNVSAYLKTHPNDPEANFTLGRIHYFQFALRSQTTKVDTFRGSTISGGSNLPILYHVFGPPGKAYGSLDETPANAAAIANLKPAILSIQKAIVLRDRQGKSSDLSLTQPPPGLYELCLACVFEEGAPYAARVGQVPGATAATPKAWREAAIANYAKAFAVSSSHDNNMPSKPPFGIDTLVSHESGASYLRLVKTRGVLATEKARVAQAEQFLDGLDHLPRGPVTPILFSLEKSSGLTSLLAPGKTVHFDLNGGGEAQRWPWVKPTTAILVWQPDPRRPITSGRQLFGNVTWWMFWDNGYRALDALDNNRDGWLTGSELHGLAVWQDRNSDGIAQSQEVTPIEQTPIIGLSVHSTGREGKGLVSEGGLRLRDGRTLPTYDWVAEPKRG